MEPTTESIRAELLTPRLAAAAPARSRVGRLLADAAELAEQGEYRTAAELVGRAWAGLHRLHALAVVDAERRRSSCLACLEGMGRHAIDCPERRGS